VRRAREIPCAWCETAIAVAGKGRLPTYCSSNYHHAQVSNGPTEALNNLIKRIKRIGFGFRNFDNYRIRALLYAGKPNWRVLNSIIVQ
jgi:hypothetical protein